MAKIMEAIRKVKPDALIEMRPNSSNINNKRVVNAYLDFYHAHKADLITADFRPVGPGRLSPHFALEGRDAFPYSDTASMPETTLRKPRETVYVFNASDKPEVELRIRGLKPGRCAWIARDALRQVTASGDADVPDGVFTWTAPIRRAGCWSCHSGVETRGPASE